MSAVFLSLSLSLSWTLSFFFFFLTLVHPSIHIHRVTSWKYDVNITRIESRPVTSTNNDRPKFDFFVDFHGKVGDPNVNSLLFSLKQFTDRLLVLDEKEVHWFPRHISELDLIANRTLDAGTDLTSDHPGFNDVEYRQRREKLAHVALNYRIMNQEPIPTTEYTTEEVETWALVWDTMEKLWDKYACKEYKVCFVFYFVILNEVLGKRCYMYNTLILFLPFHSNPIPNLCRTHSLFPLLIIHMM